MTRLGEFLIKKSVNKSEVSRRTGISRARISELTLNENTKLRVDELYLIALAIDVSPCEMFEFICKGLKLKDPN